MRRIFSCLIIFLILITALLGLYYYYFLYNNCHLPIGYSIGAVDSRFKINQDELLKTTQDAAERWNFQTGYSLLEYSPTASLKINLIYDQRQENLNQVNAQIQTLSEKNVEIENYQKEYENLLSKYQNDLNSYNEEIAYWNIFGGAPANIYQDLQDQKRKLQERRDGLVNLAKTLNLQAQNYNENLSDLKTEINSRKNLIVTQGIYDSTTNTINIYTFGNTDELRLVLMHELGHALGLGHAQNSTSIMYQLLDQQDLKNPILTDEDKNLLELKCNLNNHFYFTQYPSPSELISTVPFWSVR